MWKVTLIALIAIISATSASRPRVDASHIILPFATELAEKDWWETASFYQIYPRSFMDSNGDGIGDLNGIRQKLPYLRSLGITAAWLSPIFLSPMKDFGYDIQDFFSIQPEYGTMQDFDNLIADAKRLGLKIILDFVPNHSSDLNQWFINSTNRVSGFEDFYIWQDGITNADGTRSPPNNWVSVFRGSGWEWNEKRQQYYYHAFAKQQPDLNYRNENVVKMMKSVLTFWLDRGVAGFRIDAVPHMFECQNTDGSYPDEPLSGTTTDKDDYGYLTHTCTQSQDETFDMVYQWRELMDAYKSKNGGDTRVMLTEAYVDIEKEMRFYQDSNGRLGSHIPMNFYLIMNLNKNTNAKDFKDQVDLWMNNMPAGRTANWVLGNHDQRRVASRFGTERIDMLNMIIKSLPGASITYNGEEIGMTDVWISWDDTVDPQACNTNKDIYEPYSRDPARTPIQWDNTTSAGFSTNSTTWLPVGPDYKLVNVKLQERSSTSHLNIYRSLVRMRKQDVFKYGTLATIATENDQVLVIIRYLDSEHDTYIAVANFGTEAKTLDLNSVKRDIHGPIYYEWVDSASDMKRGKPVNARSVHIFPSESFVLRVPPKSSANYYKYEVFAEESD